MSSNTGDEEEGGNTNVQQESQDRTVGAPERRSRLGDVGPTSAQNGKPYGGAAAAQ